MTFLTQTPTPTRPFRIIHTVQRLARYWTEHRRQRATDMMLDRMTEKQKADLGIHPGWHADAGFDIWQK